MFLAPLNYDRYFKKVFSDSKIAQPFLEDALGVEIHNLEPLGVRHKLTDAAADVEFDYRCKMNGIPVIIDMQQWYKTDVVQRFYLYHAINTGLQLEGLPKKKIKIDRKTFKLIEVKDYSSLEPVYTIIWMATDTLKFKQNSIGYQMTPEVVQEFVKDKKIWLNPEIQELLKKREEVLSIMDNKTKNLPFLGKNRLIFLFQKNIVRDAMKNDPFAKWFHFAECSLNKKNTEEDFLEFRGDEVFEEMIRRLNKTNLTEEDFQYIESEENYWKQSAGIEENIYQGGFKHGEISGKEKGIEQGIEQGKKKKALEMATLLKEKGMEMEEVAEISGLSLEEIASL